MTIENGFPTAWYAINGNVHLHEGVALPSSLPAVTPPVNIINTGQDLYVHFVWNESGILSNSLLGWNFECRVYFELMGSGETAANPAPVLVPFNTASNSYSQVINISAGSLTEGTYRVVATLMLKDPSGTPTPLAAYEEIGMLQVYQSA